MARYLALSWPHVACSLSKAALLALAIPSQARTLPLTSPSSAPPQVPPSAPAPGTYPPIGPPRLSQAKAQVPGPQPPPVTVLLTPVCTGVPRLQSPSAQLLQLLPQKLKPPTRQTGEP